MKSSQPTIPEKYFKYARYNYHQARFVCDCANCSSPCYMRGKTEPWVIWACTDLVRSITHRETQRKKLLHVLRKRVVQAIQNNKLAIHENRGVQIRPSDVKLIALQDKKNIGLQSNVAVMSPDDRRAQFHNYELIERKWNHENYPRPDRE